ncbi:MAG TPA: 4-demethylwyosine synthase TYW1, partial [Archaeoglobus profundus]|nr:4-demethylwyosine synthase TYW1 [Archaeoglobus profundus]
IEEFKRRGFTTFVVSNGTRPEMIESIEPTQLYISLTAYNEESHLRLNRPVRSFWDNIMKSLEIMSQKTCRTVIRLTLVKGYNMEAVKFAPLIEKASPMFVETKAYMYLGYSRLRLPREAMPEHEEVRRFAEELAKITGYEIADESVVSRVVLLKAT